MQIFYIGNGFRKNVGGINEAYVYQLLRVNNKYLVVGDFYRYSNTNCQNIIRLNADGTYDETFNLLNFINGAIKTVDVDIYGRIYIGGDFTNINGEVRNRIARLDSDGNLDLTFADNDGFDGNVLKIQLNSAGKIYVCGEFETYDSNTLNSSSGIMRLNSNGSIDTLFKNLDNLENVNDFHVNSNGIYVIGNFIKGIIKLDLFGNKDISFDVGTGFSGSDVRTITSDSNGNIYVGGVIYFYNDNFIKNIVKIKPDGTYDSNFYNADFDYTIIYKLKIIDNWLYTGTYSFIANNEIYYGISRISLDGQTHDTSLDLGSGSHGGIRHGVFDLIEHLDGSLILGGYFMRYINQIDVKSYYNKIIKISKTGELETSLDAIPPEPPVYNFCYGSHFDLIPNQCGYTNGQLIIEESYLKHYDFYLLDIEENNYNLNITGSSFIDLPSSFYFFTAKPKPEYWNAYGRDGCTFEWMAVNPTNTTILIENISIKPEQTGEKGRLVISINDLPNSNYDVYFYDDKKTLLKKLENVNTTNFIYEGRGCVYVIIRNLDNGCSLCAGKFCIPVIFDRAIGGLKEIYIAPYDVDSLNLNYWKSDDEDFFVSSLDKSFFYSTKIKNIENQLNWYKLPVDRNAKYSEEMQVTRQGIMYFDTVQIYVPKQTAFKLQEIMEMVENKFVIVIKDSNNSWWITGHQLPCKLTSIEILTNLKQSTNEYQLTFSSNNLDSMLTAIDFEFTKNNILN